MVTLANYFELFNGILNPKQLEGLRLLLTPFPQQQFNATDDRRSLRPSTRRDLLRLPRERAHQRRHPPGRRHPPPGVPPSPRHALAARASTSSGCSARSGHLKTVEDFTEFEQRAAYFDGDPVIATKKGVNILERGSQVHFMAEFLELLDFPPAPKLDVFGALDPKKASNAPSCAGRRCSSSRAAAPPVTRPPTTPTT